MKFCDLQIGDMFSTPEARYVKVDDEQAVCVMSAVLTVGEFYVVNKSIDLIVLYSATSDPLRCPDCGSLIEPV